MSLLTALVDYWKLDELSGTRFASKSAAHDMTPINGPGRALGKLNYGAELIRADQQYLELVASNDFQVGDRDLTIAFWIKYLSSPSDRGVYVVSKDDPPDQVEYLIYSVGVPARFTFHVADISTAATTLTASSFGALAADTWYFVIARHDAVNDVISLQVNNGTVDSTPWSTGIAALTNALRIGAFSGGGTDYPDAIIDGVGIWISAPGAGGCLTPAQGAALWNGGAGLDYPFDEAAVIVRFGNFTFPAGFKIEEDPLSRAIGVAKATRQDGARVQTGTLAEKRVTIRGGLIYQPIGNAGGDTWRDALMNIRQAVAQGPASLYPWTDRYYPNMQCVDYRQSTPDSDFGRVAMIELDMVGPTPFLVSTVETEETWTSPVDASTHQSAPGGTAYSLPTFTFTIGGAGAQTLGITMTNEANGEVFTLTGAADAGDIVIVDCDAKTVTISAADRTDLFDGLFLRLEAGANTLSLGLTGCTLSALAIAWRDRWY